MTIITTLLLALAATLGTGDSGAHATAVPNPQPVVSTITVGSDGSLSSFAG